MDLSIVGVREDGNIRVPVFMVFGGVVSDTCNERPIESFDPSVSLRAVRGRRQMLNLKAREDLFEELGYNLRVVIGKKVIRGCIRYSTIIDELFGNLESGGGLHRY